MSSVGALCSQERDDIHVTYQPLNPPIIEDDSIQVKHPSSSIGKQIKWTVASGGAAVEIRRDSSQAKGGWGERGGIWGRVDSRVGVWV